MQRTIIASSGHYLPSIKVENSHFLDKEFYDEKNEPITRSNQEIIEKFQAITEISERRYVTDNLLTSDIAALSAKEALSGVGLNPEELDYIFVAHNFGDLKPTYKETDIMPSLSAKVKHILGIKNPSTKPYDVIFGCPGWIEAFIMGHQFLSSGLGKNALVVGAETLSRVIDEHDRNSMIFADGAGAVVITSKNTDEKEGVISYKTRSDTGEELSYLINEPSLKPEYGGGQMFIRMKGRKVYEYALKHVPNVAKAVLDEAGIHLKEVNKVLIHQANAKMDYAIMDRLCKLYGMKSCHQEIAPMTIQTYGNSSVATIPTLYDKLVKGEINGHTVNSGDYILMASVGAGMNINALLYKIP